MSMRSQGDPRAIPGRCHGAKPDEWSSAGWSSEINGRETQGAFDYRLKDDAIRSGR